MFDFIVMHADRKFDVFEINIYSVESNDNGRSLIAQTILQKLISIQLKCQITMEATYHWCLSNKASIPNTMNMIFKFQYQSKYNRSLIFINLTINFCYIFSRCFDFV